MCAQAVSEWTEDVFSPATLPGSGRVWREAGFVEWGQLLLFEHLLTDLRAPEDLVAENAMSDVVVLNRIDRDSFPPAWRLGPIGLAESVGATSRSAIHTVAADGEVVGFAVTGVSLGVGYLQRLAVDPKYRGRGLGRSLVRASLTWARRRRAISLLVNTQPDNDQAVGLYRGEGFNDVATGLQIWRFDRTPGTNRLLQ
jgi:ribosomal-protein-alanine N-acetyltransferase